MKRISQIPPEKSQQINKISNINQLDLCDYSDVYILVKRTITVTGANNKDRKNWSLLFKNNASFISFILNIIDIIKTY